MVVVLRRAERRAERGVFSTKVESSERAKIEIVSHT